MLCKKKKKGASITGMFPGAGKGVLHQRIVGCVFLSIKDFQYRVGFAGTLNCTYYVINSALKQ